MVVGSAYAEACRQAVPDIAPGHVLVEPIGKNTAPAIGLAAAHLEREDPEALLVVLASDHHIRNEPAWVEALKKAATAAADGSIATVGLRPTRAETGYGYIQRGEPVGQVAGAWRVARFREKPDTKTAEQFVASGDHFWNASVFVMQPKTYFAELTRQRPAMARSLRKIQEAIGTPNYGRVLGACYAEMESISIDYAVMEHAERVTVVSADCGWSDVGSWAALGEVREADTDGNVIAGDVVAVDSRDCVLYASPQHVVAVVGLDGIIVVHTPEATLALPASRAQDVRSIVDKLREKGWKAFL